jgi:hypothetical protein
MIKIKGRRVSIHLTTGHFYSGVVLAVCEKFVQLTDVVADNQMYPHSWTFYVNIDNIVAIVVSPGEEE